MQRGAVNSTAPRRGAPRPELVRVGVFAGGLVLAGLGAAVAGSVAGELTAPGATTAVRLVLLVSGALVTGLGLVHPLVGTSARPGAGASAGSGGGASAWSGGGAPARSGAGASAGLGGGASAMPGGGASAGPGPWHRRVAWVSGLLAATAALAGYLHEDVGRTGTLAWVVAALAVPALLEIRHPSTRWTVPVVALPGAVLVAVTFGSAHTGVAFAADAVHAVASALLLGALAALALRALGDAAPGAGSGQAADRGLDQDGGAVGARSNSSDVLVDDRARSARSSSGPASAPGWPVRLATVGVVSAVVAALAGVARILTAGPYSVTDLVGTAYGRTALVAVALPALAAAVLAILSRTAGRRAAPVAEGATHRGGVRHDADVGKVRHHADAGGVRHDADAGKVRHHADVGEVRHDADAGEVRLDANAVGVRHGAGGVRLDADAGGVRHGAGGVRLDAEAGGVRNRASADSRTPADQVWSGVLAGAIGAVAALGIAAASVAGLLPAPAPAAVPGQALMRTVALDGEDVPVVIAPMRPGPNLVQLGGSGYPATGDAIAPPPITAATPATPATPSTLAPPSTRADPGTSGHDMSGTPGTGGHEMTGHGGSATVAADGDPVGFVSRPGAHGGWAVVDVPAGTTSLTVEMAGDSATVPVDVGDGTGGAPSSALTGRDGPECASAIVGAVLGGAPGAVTGCPSQTLDPQQAGALVATVRTMAEKGARNVRLVGDASPRSVAAARLVRDEGTKAGLAFTPDAVDDPNSALVVVSGWEQAVDVLGQVRQRAATTPTHLGGTFLAPWLLTGDVLRQTASAFLPLSFAPNEPDGQRYALALAATHPDTAPSASGYLAWARATGVGTDPRPSLYGAAAVNVPMSIEPQGSSGHHGGPDPAAWFPGGTVVPVSGPMGPGGSS